MPKGLSPTQRTLRALRERGYACDIAERHIAKAGPFGLKKDLFGIIDIIALAPGPQGGVIGIQSTGIDIPGHVKKFKEERFQSCLDWITTRGTRLEIWGWRKVKVKRGGKAVVYRPRVLVVTINVGKDELIFTEGESATQLSA